MQITVYSTTTCPYCKLLKDYIASKNVAFTEKLVDQDDAAKTEMESFSGGFLGVPYTIISFEDGRKESVIGFDKNKIDQLLTISK